MADSNQSPVTILVVDDSFFMRKVICDLLAADPRISIVGQAVDGVDAIQKINELHPDIMTLDLVMPRMDGLEVLRTFHQASYAPATIMVSSQTREAAQVTLDCLEAGAIDFVLKPSESDAWQLQDTATELRAKIDIAVAVVARSAMKTVSASGAHKGMPQSIVSRLAYNAVVIGASTGGPVALDRILPELPATPGCPIIVAQHMPADFIAVLTQRLATKCKATVAIAQDGQPVRSDVVYFCQGGAITEIIDRQGPVFQVRSSDALLTPSIDALIASAAGYYSDRLAAIILTGMGKDGLQGVLKVHEEGGTVIVQDQASSAVFGMGKAVIESDLADIVVSLDEIMPLLVPKLPGVAGA